MHRAFTGQAGDAIHGALDNTKIGVGGNGARQKSSGAGYSEEQARDRATGEREEENPARQTRDRLFKRCALERRLH